MNKIIKEIKSRWALYLLVVIIIGGLYVIFSELTKDYCGMAIGFVIDFIIVGLIGLAIYQQQKVDEQK